MNKTNYGCSWKKKKAHNLEEGPYTPEFGKVVTRSKAARIACAKSPFHSQAKRTNVLQ